MKAEILFNCKNIIGEGALWDVKQQNLYWIDIMGKKLMSWDGKNSQFDTLDINQYIGTVAVCENESLLLALHNGIYFFNIETKELTKISDPEANLPLNRFNDGKCDPAGRFWAGTMEIEPVNPTGSVYLMDHDLSVDKKIENVTISNGLTWSLDHSKMYYIDTPSNEIKIFNYDNKTGDIEFDRILVSTDGKSGFFDGMTIDENGNLWVAMYSGSCVKCYDKETGEVLNTVELPTSHVTTCAFGGENLDTLYITTAINGLSTEQLENEPLAGGIFKANVGVKGVPSFRFKN
ncbi:MAG: SMP-30/gluconolactonase/LRE family protein [Flavobacteriales bacterium]|nr:SMP-30/gluconolactonase/LRE family protein [Flavobacteriales bacterium]